VRYLLVAAKYLEAKQPKPKTKKKLETKTFFFVSIDAIAVFNILPPFSFSAMTSKKKYGIKF
jgi:hypothetical protein